MMGFLRACGNATRKAKKGKARKGAGFKAAQKKAMSRDDLPARFTR